MEAKSFDSWMAEVDAELVRICGIDSDDLGDYLYYDSYESGESAADVARAALEYNLECLGVDSELLEQFSD